MWDIVCQICSREGRVNNTFSILFVYFIYCCEIYMTIMVICTWKLWRWQANGQKEWRKERKRDAREGETIAGETGKRTTRPSPGRGDEGGKGNAKMNTKSAARGCKIISANNRRLERERRFPIFNYVSVVCARWRWDGLSLLLTFQLRSTVLTSRYTSRGHSTLIKIIEARGWARARMIYRFPMAGRW